MKKIPYLSSFQRKTHHGFLLVFIFLMVTLCSCNQFFNCSTLHKKRPPSYVWIKRTIQKSRTVVIDMGGVSTKKIPTAYTSPRTFHYGIGTNTPRTRIIKNFREGKIRLQCYSNNDTGKDMVIINVGEKQVFESLFDESSFEIPLRTNGTILTITVLNTTTPYQSPGAFQLTAVIEKYYFLHIWERVRI